VILDWRSLIFEVRWTGSSISLPSSSSETQTQNEQKAYRHKDSCHQGHKGCKALLYDPGQFGHLTGDTLLTKDSQVDK
jgi:hypothetical protein